MSMNNEFWRLYNNIDRHVHMLQSGPGQISEQTYAEFSMLKKQVNDSGIPEQEHDFLSDFLFMVDSEYKARLNKYVDSTGG